MVINPLKIAVGIKINLINVINETLVVSIVLTIKYTIHSSKTTTPITSAIIAKTLIGMICEINLTSKIVIIGNKHVYKPIRSV